MKRTRKDADGVVCPKCECPEVPVNTTRHSGRVTIRYRRCANPNCRYAFRTTETGPRPKQSENQQPNEDSH